MPTYNCFGRGYFIMYTKTVALQWEDETASQQGTSWKPFLEGPQLIKARQRRPSNESIIGGKWNNTTKEDYMVQSKIVSVYRVLKVYSIAPRFNKKNQGSRKLGFNF